MIPFERTLRCEQGRESSRSTALWRSGPFNLTEDKAVETINFHLWLRCHCAFQNELSFTKGKAETDLFLEEHRISNMITNKNDPFFERRKES